MQNAAAALDDQKSARPKGKVRYIQHVVEKYVHHALTPSKQACQHDTDDTNSHSLRATLTHLPEKMT